MIEQCGQQYRYNVGHDMIDFRSFSLKTGTCQVNYDVPVSNLVYNILLLTVVLQLSGHLTDKQHRTCVHFYVNEFKMCMCTYNLVFLE